LIGYSIVMGIISKIKQRRVRIPK